MSYEPRFRAEAEADFYRLPHPLRAAVLHHVERLCEAPGDFGRSTTAFEPDGCRAFDCSTVLDDALDVFTIFFIFHPNERELVILAIWHERRTA